MMQLRRIFPHPLFLCLLLLAAFWLPLPLYVVSLALFGLPHVIWEMGFLRSRYAGRWPLRWWLALWAVLLAQAGIRGAVWLGTYPATSSQIVDLLSLLMLGMIVALAPSGIGWRARMAGLLMAGALLWLLEQGDVLTALLLLAILHNFTPLAMVWDMARDDRSGRADPGTRRLAWAISGLFALPLLMAGSPWGGAIAPSMMAAYRPLLDGQWPLAWGGTQRQALLSAVVLAQCLHYYCVIVLLPRAERRRTTRPVIFPAVRFGALTAAALMLAYYAHDYGGARKLYAVAAGVHAWLEWPVLLMAFLCVGQRGEVGAGEVNRLRPD